RACADWRGCHLADRACGSSGPQAEGLCLEPGKAKAEPRGQVEPSKEGCTMNVTRNGFTSALNSEKDLNQFVDLELARQSMKVIGDVQFLARHRPSAIELVEKVTAALVLGTYQQRAEHKRADSKRSTKTNPSGKRNHR